MTAGIDANTGYEFTQLSVAQFTPEEITDADGITYTITNVHPTVEFTAYAPTDHMDGKIGP